VSRGVSGAFERAWSGAPGSVPWTWALYPLAVAYAAGSAMARARAARTRRSIPGLRVIAVGGLTAGGSGKSSVAGWLAAELRARGAAAAVLLRGHGAIRPGAGPYIVPDYEDYPRWEGLVRGGDEAMAHRGVLPAEVTVGVGRDRYASARRARAGYGAGVAILDDGWEQRGLRWDDLWVVLDPERPIGNGAPLPAGPLRRPVSSLRQAAVIALVSEGDGEEIDASRLGRIRSWAPTATVLRFRRALASISPLGQRHRGGRRPDASATAAARALPPAGLLSGVGAPERLERFARGAGVRIVSHAAFPDHAAWTSGQIEGAFFEAARKGAGVILTTEKDEARWPARIRSALPVLVLRTTLEPLDPVDAALDQARGAVASPAAIR
jgi:tetraacyldisaccharide 4'-kinase